ncbi:MAG: cohesin domain-containing protein [Verrucomicrobiia bacterium]
MKERLEIGQYSMKREVVNSSRVDGPIHATLIWGGLAKVTFLAGALFALVIPSHLQAQLTITADIEGSMFQGSIVDVPIVVSGFENIESMSFTLTWDSTVLQLRNTSSVPGEVSDSAVGDLGLPGLALSGPGISFGNPNSTSLTVAWAEGPYTKPSGTIFTVHFDAVGAPASTSALAFTDIPTEREVFAGGVSAPITSEVGFIPGSVTISAVPEPASGALAMSACLVGVAAACRGLRPKRLKP